MLHYYGKVSKSDSESLCCLFIIYTIFDKLHENDCYIFMRKNWNFVLITFHNLSCFIFEIVEEISVNIIHYLLFSVFLLFHPFWVLLADRMSSGWFELIWRTEAQSDLFIELLFYTHLLDFCWHNHLLWKYLCYLCLR